jgi:uncharacterized protein (TIGR02246 family)
MSNSITRPPTLIVALSLLLLGGCGSAQTTHIQEKTGMTEQSTQADDKAIRALLARYELALNSSDTEAVMALYTDDGVFMPQHFPSAVGSSAVRTAYDGVFKAIKLDVTFDVVEVRQVSPNWAFARTNSAGTVRVLADDSGGPEANQELFVLEKSSSGDWKIARYCFSTTNPPRG